MNRYELYNKISEKLVVLSDEEINKLTNIQSSKNKMGCLWNN